jgi:hypothetical protein
MEANAIFRKVCLGWNDGGKWFAETLGNAREWGAKLGNDVIIRLNVPISTVETWFRSSRLDGIGPARWATLEEFEKLGGNVQRIP